MIKCVRCYNHCLKLLNASKEISCDKELQDVLQNIPLTVIEHEYEDHILDALSTVMYMLGEVLMKRMAVLFPEVYDKFLATVESEAKKKNATDRNLEVATVMPRKCLLMIITTVFGKHLSCERHHFSQGILFYRQGTNLGQTLAAVLSMVRRHGLTMLDSHSITSEEGNRQGVNSHYCNSTEECFKKATNVVNNLIHEESTRIIENDAQMPFDIASFDADIMMN